jgi:hypothetical protein
MEITNFKQLLEIGLELDSPWEIEKIEFNGESGRLEVEINYQDGLGTKTLQLDFLLNWLLCSVNVSL